MEISFLATFPETKHVLKMDGGGETTLVFVVPKSEIPEISKIPENFLERLLKVTIEDAE